MKYLSFKEVTERLGLSARVSLEKLLGKELPSGRTFEPTVKSGNIRYFEIDIVEEFEKAYRDENGMTVNEIAEMYGKHVNTVRFHLKKKRDVKPKGKRGRFETFDQSVVAAIAQAELWTLPTRRETSSRRDGEEQ